MRKKIEPIAGENVDNDPRLSARFRRECPLTSRKLNTHDKVDKFPRALYALQGVYEKKGGTFRLSPDALGRIVEEILEGHDTKNLEVVEIKEPPDGTDEKLMLGELSLRLFGHPEFRDFVEVLFTGLKSVSGGSGGYTFRWKQDEEL